MINYLLVTDELDSIKNLINNISNRIPQTRLYNISTSVNDGIDVLKENVRYIDTIILNLKFNDVTLFLDLIEKEYCEKYEHSIIIIKNSDKEIIKEKYRTLIYNEVEKNKIENIINDINNLVELKKNNYSIAKNKIIIIKYLQKLGYNFTHLGTKYLIEILMFLLENDIDKCPDLNNVIYPIIANKYRTNINTVKCVITRATKYMNNHLRKEHLDYFVDNYFNTKAVINLLLIKMNN